MKEDDDPEEEPSSSSLVTASPSTGELDVIWNWILPPKRQEGKSPFFWIAKEVCRGLSAYMADAGFIYAFKCLDPQAMGYFKVGSAVSIRVRMNKHKLCYGECEQVFPPIGEPPIPVQHVRRVEALIHAELVKFSLHLETCPKNRGRHQSHGEWFDVDENLLIAVIQKRSRWTSTSPYEELEIQTTPRRKSSQQSPGKEKWRLRDLDTLHLAKICIPIYCLAMGESFSSEIGGFDELDRKVKRLEI
jgi:hypothetical protein